MVPLLTLVVVSQVGFLAACCFFLLPEVYVISIRSLFQCCISLRSLYTICKSLKHYQTSANQVMPKRIQVPTIHVQGSRPTASFEGSVVELGTSLCAEAS